MFNNIFAILIARSNITFINFVQIGKFELLTSSGALSSSHTCLVDRFFHHQQKFLAKCQALLAFLFFFDSDVGNDRRSVWFVAPESPCHRNFIHTFRRWSKQHMTKRFVSHFNFHAFMTDVFEPRMNNQSIQTNHRLFISLLPLLLRTPFVNALLHKSLLKRLASVQHRFQHFQLVNATLHQLATHTQTVRRRCQAHNRRHGLAVDRQHTRFDHLSRFDDATTVFDGFVGQIARLYQRAGAVVKETTHKKLSHGRHCHLNKRSSQQRFRLFSNNHEKHFQCCWIGVMTTRIAEWTTKL
mmetsp:Transcript_11953/g.19925  ORF Transcript_11953/g.19925 Transcript_11953/m.19925 type:complete len:298 (-) Transcript_11953:310-1203(-)